MSSHAILKETLLLKGPGSPIALPELPSAGHFMAVTSFPSRVDNVNPQKYHIHYTVKKSLQLLFFPPHLHTLGLLDNVVVRLT